MPAHAQLLGAVPHGTDPIVATHGVDPFTYPAPHPTPPTPPRRMAAGARLQAVMIEGSLDLATARSVLDVGGSTGPLIASCSRPGPSSQGRSST